MAMTHQQYKPHPIREPLTAEDIDYNFDLIYRLLKDLVTFVGDVLQVSKGGTGLSSYLKGDLLYANDPTSLATLNAVATGSALVSRGVQTPPIWGKVVLVDPDAMVSGFSARGDLLTYSGSAYMRLPVGANGTFLRASSSVPAGLDWVAGAGGGGTDLDTILTDGDHLMLDDDGNVLWSG